MKDIEVGQSIVTTPEELFAKMDMIIDGLKSWVAAPIQDDEMLAILVHRAQELHGDFGVLDDNNPMHWQTAGTKVMEIKELTRQSSVRELNAQFEQG